MAGMGGGCEKGETNGTRVLQNTLQAAPTVHNRADTNAQFPNLKDLKHRDDPKVARCSRGAIEHCKGAEIDAVVTLHRCGRWGGGGR